MLALCNFKTAFKVTKITQNNVLIMSNIDIWLDSYNNVIWYHVIDRTNRTKVPSIECFHPRSQHLCKFTGTKECVCIRKELDSYINSTGLAWDTNMAVVSLFWDTDMAALTSCENTLFFHFSSTILNLPFNHLRFTHFSNNALKNQNYIKFDKMMVNQV